MRAAPRTNMGATTKKSVKSGISIIIKLLAEHKIYLAVVSLLTILEVVVSVFGPLLLGKATNVIFNGVVGKLIGSGQTKAQAVESIYASKQDALARVLEGSGAIPGQGIDFSALGYYLFIALAVYASLAILLWISGILLRNMVQIINYDIRERTQSKIDKIPLSYLDQQRRGDLLSTVNNDVDNLSQTLMSSHPGFKALCTVVGVVVMMLYLSITLSIVSFIALPLGILFSAILIKKAGPEFRKQWTKTGELSAVVEDAFSGHQVMLAYNLPERISVRFDKANEAITNSASRAQFFSGLINPMTTAMANISFVLVALVGAIQVISGNLTLGFVQAFIQYNWQLSEPVNQIANMAAMLQSGAASTERIYKFLEVEEMPEENSTHTISTSTKGHVKFENVCFGYSPDSEVISNLNLEVKPGQTVAIVGHTGAGKTTIVNLLLRFYEISSGRILLDEVDISTISKSELRNKFGMVLQNTWLFSGTIADNIAYGANNWAEKDINEKEHKTQSQNIRERVIQAAKDTSVHRMITTLPSGYETMVDEEGEGISAGQKQLITIARAHISNPEIIILDEATSSVDTYTEKLVQSALTKLRKGKTAFVIAHRLSTIRDADIIAVVDQGNIVEIGTHEELIARDGAYSKLYKSQFSVSE